MTETFSLTTTWTGNRGSGTSDYRAYGRDHEMSTDGKGSAILASAAPKFRGDRSRYSPEELLVGAVSACHMLWFLHLCSDARIAVTAYRDDAQGTMAVNADGSGQFTEITLHPKVQLGDDRRQADLRSLHERAHAMCFIARSLNFPVTIGPD